MKPVLYRYRDSESVIKHMDGYTPGEGWEPLYSQDQVDQLQAQLVRQQKSYEAEIKVETDSALERAAEVCETPGTGPVRAMTPPTPGVATSATASRATAASRVKVRPLPSA